MTNTYRRTILTGLLLTAVLALGCSTVIGAAALAPDSGPHPAGWGDADGYVPDGQSLSAFAEVPALTKLEAPLRAALQAAATEAQEDGRTLRVNSGWRSRAFQKWLLDDAVRTYGSVTEARRWVATPEESRHTVGAAVDIGPPSAAAWLEEHGSDWGLCRVFENEPWHFELVGTAGGCPALVPDARQ